MDLNRLRYVLVLILAVFLVVLNVPSVGWGTTFYVDPNGVDTSARDGSPSQPWATLSFACSKVPSGEHTIHINPGIYTDNNQCVLKIGTDIEGAGKHSVTITTNYAGAYIKGHSASITAGNHKIHDFTLQGGTSPANRNGNMGIWFRDRTDIEIYDMAISFFECPSSNYRPGGIEIENTTVTSSCSDPGTWLTGISIHDVEITASARHKSGNNNSGSIHVYGVDGFQLYNSTLDESATDGQTVKGTDGWGFLKSASIHDNTFTVATAATSRNEPFVIELWNLQEDSEIYNNTFNNGNISLVSGHEKNGTWALKFHDNTINNAIMSEFSVDPMDIYNNYFQGKFETGGWARGSSVALWGTRCDAESAMSNWIFRNNVMYDVSDFAIYIIASCVYLPMAYDNIHIYNNVFDGVDEWGYGINIDSSDASNSYTNFEIKNNIFMNCAGTAVMAGGSDDDKIVGLELTNNLFYSNGTNYDLSGTTTPTISNNLTEAPGINSSGNRPSPYYKPTNEEANIVDAGTYVGLPFSGSAPDVGAFEYNPGPDPDPPDPPSGVKIIK